MDYYMHNNPRGLKKYKLVGTIGDLERKEDGVVFIASASAISHYVQVHGETPDLDGQSDNLMSLGVQGRYDFEAIAGIFKKISE